MTQIKMNQHNICTFEDLLQITVIEEEIGDFFIIATLHDGVFFWTIVVTSTTELAVLVHTLNDNNAFH
ncbi:hypothetical protein ACJX0J_034396, partial [Zea mays]